MVSSGSSPTIAAVSITSYPDNITGAVIVDSAVKVYAEGWIEVESTNDGVGTYLQNTLTCAAGDFSVTTANDRLVLTPTGAQVLEDLSEDFIASSVVPGTDYLIYSGDVHEILAVLSEHRLLIAPTITVPATAGFFAGVDAGYTATYSVGDNSPSYDNAVTSTTGRRRAWREVKLFKDASADFTTSGVIAGHYLKIGADLHLITSVVDANHLLIEGSLVGAPQNKGEFATHDASANVAYSIGTTAGAYKNIINNSLSGTGQRLESTSAIRRVFSVTSATVVNTVQFLPFSGTVGAPIYVRAEHEITNSNYASGSDGWLLSGTTVNATTKEITIPADRTVTYAAGSRKVIAASLYVQYNSLRQDKTAELSEADPNALDSDLGTDSSANVLRRAVGIAVANAGASKVHYIAVPTDDLTGHTQAMAILANDRAAYALAPMTRSNSILSSYVSHVNSLSTPTKGRRRILLCQPAELPSEKVVTSALADGTAESASVLFSPTADFDADNVVPGDVIVLSSPTTNEYTVSSVLSGNRLQITGGSFTGGEQAAVGAVAFTVVRALDKAGQVEELKAIPPGYNNKRVYTIWPDSCDISTDTNESGMYLAAAVTGLLAGIPSHRMTTKISLAGISKINHSNNYFDDEQMEELVDAGWYMIEQANSQSAVYTSQQYSTLGNAGSVEEKYLSSVRNFDHVSAEFQEIVNAYPGDWNVIDDLFTSLEESLKQKAYILMLDKRPKIGAPLLGYSSLRVQPSGTQSDKVEAFMKVRLPKVLNELDLYLISE
jgi:hypothetical protein